MPSGILTLLVAGLHSHAGIRAGRVDRAASVSRQEPAGLVGSQHDAPSFVRQLVHRGPPAAHVCIKDSRLAEHVQIVRLDDQRALATCAAAVTFIS